jgi:hypothetical protein
MTVLKEGAEEQASGGEEGRKRLRRLGLECSMPESINL